MALAQHSRHPVSQAIAKILDSDAKVENWEEIRGSGIRGSVVLPDGAKAEVRLGSLPWLKELGLEGGGNSDFVQFWSGDGATIVGLALENQLQALFAVKDVVKIGVRSILQQLQRKGLKTLLVTGDTKLTAMSIAKQAGFAAEDVKA